MADLDRTLAQISALPLDTRLGSIDKAVLAALEGRSARTHGVPTLAVSLAALAAFGVGLVGAALPRPNAGIEQPRLFGAASTLAPSALLDPSDG